MFFSFTKMQSQHLIAERKTTHTRLNTEDVVIDRKHPLRSAVSAASLHGDLDLGIVNTREVASACGLVFLGLQCEGIAVDTRVRVASVVHVGLDLVEVLTGLFLEAILAVEDELETGKRSA